MNYWKLGCNWGHGMPDFYSLLKEKRIVICGDSPMAKGDWVLICQGHDAVALAKIGSAPVPSTARVDLRALVPDPCDTVGVIRSAGLCGIMCN